METKQCVACKEDILKEALKCKHCRQIQTRTSNLPNKPIFNYLISGLFGLFILWLVIEFIQLSTYEQPDPVFDIKSSNFFLSETKKGLNIRCITTVKNTYMRSWGNFSIQAKFKNKLGDVIDVLQDKPSLSVHPLLKFDLMVSGDASAAKGEYHSCELVVLDAQ